jgi:hypothetical protein
MGKYIIILSENPPGYAVNTTMMASNRVADDLILGGHARTMDEPDRPQRESEAPPQINVTVAPDPSKVKKPRKPYKKRTKF